MLLFPWHVQKLLFLYQLCLLRWLWMRRLFGLIIWFFRLFWIQWFKFLKVRQIDSIVIPFLRVWTNIVLQSSIRISYLSVDSLSILEHHGDFDLLIIGQLLVETSFRYSIMHWQSLMMRIFPLAWMQIIFVHHSFQSIYMGASIINVLHIPR